MSFFSRWTKRKPLESDADPTLGRNSTGEATAPASAVVADAVNYVGGPSSTFQQGASVKPMADEALTLASLPPIDFQSLRQPQGEADRKLSQLAQEVNAQGGTYHRLDFGTGLVIDGIYDMSKYLPWYQLPDDLAGKTVLDIGTASGYFALECARRGATVTAIDVWDRPLLADFLPLLNTDMQYVQKNIYDLNADFGQFDLVICTSLLVHLPDQFGAIQKIRSVCRGQAIIATACPPDSETNPRPVCEFIGWKATEYDYWSYWTVGAVALTTMMRAAGFSSTSPPRHFTIESEPERPPYSTPHVVINGFV